MAQRAARRPAPLPYQPNSIVITAKRNQFGGERRLRANRQPAKTVKPVPAKKGEAAPSKVEQSNRRAIHAQIAEPMRQIRLAEARSACRVGCGSSYRLSKRKSNPVCRNCLTGRLA